MPSYVILEKCNGCKGRDRTACIYICPNDLMVLDKEKMKAYNRAPELCWECYNCIKICPQQAMDCRSYADFVPMGASAVPRRASNHIQWTVKFRNGTSKHFKFPTRTTPKGRAEPLGGYETGTDDIKSPLLCTEPASTGACELPALKKQP